MLSDDAIFCIFEDAARDAGDYVPKWWRDAGRAVEAAALAESDRTIAELRARCAELEADRERIDWLGAQIVEVNREVYANGLRYVRGDMTSDGDNSYLIRAVIDAARRQENDDGK